MILQVTDMLKNLKQLFEGAGIGLLGGLLIGITDSDWIRLVIVLALFALTTKTLKDFILKAETHTGQSFTGIAAFLAVLVGLYFNGHQTFVQSPSDAINKFRHAGFSPEEARALYLKQWEWENQKDKEPSVAVQAIIKSILDKTGSESPASNENVEAEQQDTLQDNQPGNTDVEKELPVIPAEG